MKGLKRKYGSYYLVTVLFVFALCCFYEFFVEAKFSFSLFSPEGASPVEETAAEHWEYIFTVTIFTSLALLVPTFLLFKIDSMHRKSELEKLNLQMQLNDMLTKLLGGYVGICSECKKVRVEDIQTNGEEWEPVEHYIANRSDLKFTHGYCPECYMKVKDTLHDRFKKGPEK